MFLIALARARKGITANSIFVGLEVLSLDSRLIAHIPTLIPRPRKATCDRSAILAEVAAPVHRVYYGGPT